MNAEARVMLIGSFSGDEESITEEKLFPFDEDDDADRLRAALEVAKWLREKADEFEEEARS